MRLSYDSYFNQILSISLPDGLSFTNEIDERGNIISSTSNIKDLKFQYSYNSYGQLISEREPLGGQTLYSYYPESSPGGISPSVGGRALDPETGGYLRSISTPTKSSNFGYDERGNLTDYSDSEGTVATFSVSGRGEILSSVVKTPGSEYNAKYSYDENGNILTLVESFTGEKTPRTYSFSYNLQNNLTSLTDSQKGTYTLEYDGNQNLKKVVEPTGREILYGYDSRNLLTSLTRRAGSAIITYGFGYDGNKNPILIISPRGARTELLYDGYDRFIGRIDPLGNLREHIIEGNKLSILEKDRGGNLLRKSKIVKDPMGRILERGITLKTPQGEKDLSFKYNYDLSNRKLTVKDPEGREKIYHYDNGGRLVREENPDGSWIEYSYDNAGNLSKVKENEKAPDGSIRSYETQYIYEGKRLKRIVDPLGNQTHFFYDGRGNLSGVIDPEGGKVSYDYDSLGRKIKEERFLEDGRVMRTEFGYDISNNLVSIKDSNGNITRYEYDLLGRLTKTIYPDGKFYEISYDEASNPVQVKDPNGTIVRNHYDLLNRLIRREIKRADGVEGTTFEAFEYDSLGRIVKAEDDDSEVLLSYDELNRIISENQNGKLIQYSYDSVGNLLSVKYPNQRVIEREYDLLSRLSAIKERGNPLITFSHQGVMEVGRNYGNGISMTSQLDSGRRILNMVYNKSGNPIMGYAYEWNRVGLRKSEERIHRGKFDQFSYDSQMRLKEAKIGIERGDPSRFEKHLSYFLDLVDNIQRITEAKDSATKSIETIVNSRNQYTKFGTTNLTYDSNGNLKSKDSKRFTYDYKNQLVKYQDPEKTVEFRYDPFGRRISKEVKLQNSPTPQLTNFYYEGYRVIEERDSSDKLLKQYIYGSGIDEVLRVDIYENGTSKPYYLHHNLIGSITGITDENGNIIELVEYDPYGRPYFLIPTGNPDNPYEISETSIIRNTYLFQGREYDPETGLYYFRARYYDPDLCRFLSPDPTGYVDSMNLYQAFNDNPLNFTDPLGEFRIEVASANVVPPSAPSWRFELEFKFKFDFTSPEKIGEKVIKKISETIIQHLTKKAGLETLYNILKAKGWLEKIFFVKDLIELTKQGPTIKTPMKEIKDLLDIEKWKQFLDYKMVEIVTDPEIKKLYKKLYGKEDSLTTEQAVEFLWMVRKEFPELEEIYPWEELLKLSVPEKPDAKVSAQIELRYWSLVGEYREYYLRPSGKDIYYIPSKEEIYNYLIYEWTKKVQALMKGVK